MHKFELTMRYGDRPLRKATASYVHGRDPARWLDEVARSGAVQRDVRVLPVPHSGSDRQPRGALILWPAGDFAVEEQFGPRYGQVGSRFFLPVEARLEPEVTETELEALLLEEYLYAWHPVTGLIAFEPREVLSLDELLAIPPQRSDRWDRAQPGTTLSQQLVSLMPEQELTLKAVIEDGRDGIGEQTNELSELPPSPREPRQGMAGSAARNAKRAFAQAVRWLTRRAPRTSTHPTWVNRVERWANDQLTHISEAMTAARNKELERLMHMLEQDPDRGLRFALPMGDNPFRGRGTPGDRLAERPADFDLSRLGGSGPADAWSVPAEYHYRLITRYRELANRELSLGRHRRAAYIFAELLGDFDAAAGALTAGRHWREAAVVYRDRLKRPLEAARCLEQGGLLIEAIRQYDEVEHFEKSGDLYSTLDQTEAAERSYRQAVEKERSNIDHVSAARILQMKLKSVDEAVDELASGWPHSGQAGRCLQGLFSILGETGNHAATQEWLTNFRKFPTPDRRRLELVEILTTAAGDYPDRVTQSQAADCVRVLVSDYLDGATGRESKQLLSAIARLAPEDRLLGRDCQRYLDQLAAVKKSPRKRVDRPILTRALQLPGGDVEWQAAARCDETILVAGHRDGQLVLARCWGDEVDRELRSWPLRPGLSGAPIVLTACSQSGSVLLHVIGGPRLPKTHTLLASAHSPETLEAGPVTGMSSNLAAACMSSGITWVLESRNQLLTLVGLGKNGDPISSEVIEEFELDLEFPILPIPFHAQGDRLYVGSMNELLVMERSRPTMAVTCQETIFSLAGSAANTRPRVAATFEHGGSIYWHDSDGGHTQNFGSELSRPVVGFDRLGQLIAAGRGQCHIYRTQFSNLNLIAEGEIADSPPIAVLPEPRSRQFAIVTASGEVTIYRSP